MSDYSKTPSKIKKLVLPEGAPPEREKVEFSQRRRLFLALALESHRQGYEVVSVDRLAETAMLSKTTLYELFEGKQGVLEGAVARFSRDARDAIEQAVGLADDWTAAIPAAAGALIAECVREPEMARLTFAEAPFVLTPQRTREPHSDEGYGDDLPGHDLLGALLDTAGPLDDLTRLATIGGMAAPLADRLRRGRTAELDELQPQISYLALNAHCGPDRALELSA